MKKGVKTVEEYIEREERWSEELELLRSILLRTELEETVKWGGPCYTHGGKNLVGMGAFQGYFGLWFFNGAALPDPDGVLVNAGEGRTKSLRQWRFDERSQVKKTKVLAYVRDAIAAGPPPGPVRKSKPVDLPKELAKVLAGARGAKAAFAKLTPGKQREFADHVAEAKREATRVSRAEKSLPLILAGKGLHDKYRNC